MKTLLSGGVVVTCNDQHTVHAPGDVVLDGERIQYVGPHYDGPYDVRLSMQDRLLMPGLINAHTHSSMSIFRSLADDVDLMMFLEERVWPREINLTPQDVYAGSLLSAIEMLKSGVTTYVDMYFFEEELARAALDTGARAMITPTQIQAPAWEPILGGWEQQLERSVGFCRTWEGREGRIMCGIGPHAPYTLPLEGLLEAAAEARRLDIPLHTHLVETSQERDAFNACGEGSTASVLDQHGFFEGKVLAAHSVWLDAGDVEIYSRHHVGVAHCPQSNAKLGAGIAPVAEMLAAGVQVGIGTDGPATNNNLDLWEEMRLAPLLAKVIAHDPKPLPSRQALWMATRMGAAAIHHPEIGELSEGKLGDLLVLALNDTVTVPIFGPSTYIDHLVYAMGREHVEEVWVHGKQVVKGGEVLTVDEAAARRGAQETAISISQRSGLVTG